MFYMPFVSPVYVVTDVLRKSKARYAKDIVPGDELCFEMELSDTSGASSGNYSLNFTMFVNGIEKCSLSQNELPKVFATKVYKYGTVYDMNPIFSLREKD